MLNCHEATRLMSAGQERPLRWRERLALNLHTGMCSGCRNFRQQMALLRHISRAYSQQRDDAGPVDPPR